MVEPTTDVRVFVMAREKHRLLVSTTGYLNDTVEIPRKMLTAFGPAGETLGWTSIVISTAYAAKKFVMESL